MACCTVFVDGASTRIDQRSTWRVHQTGMRGVHKEPAKIGAEANHLTRLGHSREFHGVPS
jgi:hypothetical protein